MSNTIRGNKFNLENLPQALEEILNEFSQASFEVRQEAVQKGAEVYVKAIESNTPKATGQMAMSWKIQDKYKNVRYVYNTRTATGNVYRKSISRARGQARQGVPLTNVLEHGIYSPHKGFMQRTYDAVEPQIFEAIKKTIENGVKK